MMDLIHTKETSQQLNLRNSMEYCSLLRHVERCETSITALKKHGTHVESQQKGLLFNAAILLKAY